MEEVQTFWANSRQLHLPSNHTWSRLDVSGSVLDPQTGTMLGATNMTTTTNVPAINLTPGDEVNNNPTGITKFKAMPKGPKKTKKATEPKVEVVKQAPTLVPLSEQFTPEEEQAMATATKTAPSSKKTPKVKAAASVNGKATNNGKPAKAKPEANGKESAERQTAKDLGLSLVDYRLMMCLKNNGEPMTYRQIEAKTGYYANLTAALREDKEGSLGYRKLVKESLLESETGASKLHFQLTAAGKKLISK